MVVFECIDVKMLIPAWSRCIVMARICWGAMTDHHDGGMVVLVNVRGTFGDPPTNGFLLPIPGALAGWMEVSRGSSLTSTTDY